MFRCDIFRLRVLFRTVFSHRIATHFDAMSVVNQAVEDAIGNGWIGVPSLPIPGKAVLTSSSCVTSSLIGRNRFLV